MEGVVSVGEGDALVSQGGGVVGWSQECLLSSRENHREDTCLSLLGGEVGGSRLHVIAGPCAVESREQIVEIAQAVKEAGATGLRGGAYKPRTSPYCFQGHHEEALKWLAEARDRTGLAIVTEVMEPGLVPLVSAYADVLQLGSRNMQNFALLREVGKSKKPVLFKRGMSNTVKEFMLAAEYILAEGNPNVMLCERGIRTFTEETRNTFDINAIPVLKHRSHLPVIADPSHGTGKWEYVEAAARAAVAAGADGLLIEVHNDPTRAMSDGRQSLTVERFASLMEQLRRLAPALGREL